MTATGFLEGNALDRGAAQASRGSVVEVVGAINSRLEQNAHALRRRPVQDFLRKQWQFASENCAHELAEMEGAAHAFEMDPTRVFEFLHLGIIGDLGNAAADGDGCSAWAVSESAAGPALGKNRDFLGEHAALQSVFSHADPDWKDGRRILCVGSLGCPGAYSSGMNSTGLSIADTQIATPDHGVGWLRYFLMTRLLTKQDNVASALAFVKNVPHAGGGALVLCDAGGGIAAADLGNRTIHLVDGVGGVAARTNHFEPGSVENARVAAPMRANSERRLETLRTALAQGRLGLSEFGDLLASHSGPEQEGLCRHGEDGDSLTLSGAIYRCRDLRLDFWAGNPCQAKCEVFQL